MRVPLVFCSGIRRCATSMKGAKLPDNNNMHSKTLNIGTRGNYIRHAQGHALIATLSSG